MCHVLFFGAYPQLGGPLLLSFFFPFLCKEWHSVIHFTGILSICLLAFSWNSFHWCWCTYQSHILHAILTGHFTVVFKELRVSSYQPSVGRPSQWIKQQQTFNELQLHIPQTCRAFLNSLAWTLNDMVSNEMWNACMNLILRAVFILEWSYEILRLQTVCCEL